MAAQLSSLVDKTFEANLQVDGQADKPAQGVVDLWEMEEEDSSLTTRRHGPLFRGCC